MTQLKCKECKCIITEYLEDVDKKMKYMVCPYCGRQLNNPVYEK